MLHPKHTDSKIGPESANLGETPFPVKTSHGRKYVRIELSSPVKFRLVTCSEGKLRITQEESSGEILNLSEGGMLLVTALPVQEEGFALMTLNLNRLAVLDGVLGKIKRAEASGEGDFLVGVEFTSRAELEKLSSVEQVEGLPVKVESFDRKMREVISGFLRTAELVAT
ncbi:MAG: PilZ domain-containing protein [Candidatus Zixiibacteriota bacterium]|nr:MAG: PilZ domain-containing protein [candidate division Zixibacteria bacterium]